jgi:flagellar protein FlaD
LKEKHAKLNKEQLNALVEKIKSIMRTYNKFEQQAKPKESVKTVQPAITISDTNMKKLVESIDKLEERLNNIETQVSKSGKTGSPKVVTTEDVEVPGDTSSTYEWNIDPLTEVPSDPESIVVLMKWLQYLIDKCGRDNLSNILDYYVDIGWLSQDAKISLIDYSHGIQEEKKRDETGKSVTDLPSRDHIQSLIYIQKLKGIQLDRHFIDRIDGELTRITKKLDNYNFK